MSDYVSFIEACYRVEQTEQAWLEEVAHTTARLLMFECGVHAYSVDLGAASAPLSSPIYVDGPGDWEEAWREDWWERFMIPMGIENVRALHMLSAVNYTSELFAAAAAKSTTYAEFIGTLAGRALPTPTTMGFMFPDSFNLNGLDATGRGVALAANMREPAGGTMDPRTHALWSRLATHLAAGHRLVRTLNGRKPIDGADTRAREPARRPTRRAPVRARAAGRAGRPDGTLQQAHRVRAWPLAVDRRDPPRVRRPEDGCELAPRADTRHAQDRGRVWRGAPNCVCAERCGA